MSEELSIYRKHRPTLFKNLIGQPEASSILIEMVKNHKVNQCMSFTGPSGTGKTSAARILRDKLQCGKTDYMEINAAESRGIDTVREIASQCKTAAAFGPCKIYVWDEGHALTKDAQSALLKVLEDTPPNVYFIIATTEAYKLLPTIKTRCLEVKFKSIGFADLKGLVEDVAQKENKPISERVANRIAEVGEGSARKALIDLEKVIDVKEEQAQINLILKADTERQAIDIARILIEGQRVKWSEVAAIIKEIEDPPEGIRMLILSYACSVLLGDGKYAAQANNVIQAFEEPLYKTGKAGLASAAYSVIRNKN